MWSLKASLYLRPLRNFGQTKRAQERKNELKRNKQMLTWSCVCVPLQCMQTRGTSRKRRETRKWSESLRTVWKLSTTDPCLHACNSYWTKQIKLKINIQKKNTEKKSCSAIIMQDVSQKIIQVTLSWWLVQLLQSLGKSTFTPLEWRPGAHTLLPEDRGGREEKVLVVNFPSFYKKIGSLITVTGWDYVPSKG